MDFKLKKVDMITLEIKDLNEQVNIQIDYQGKQTGFSITGDDLFSAIALFVNTQKEMEEDNG